MDDVRSQSDVDKQHVAETRALLQQLLPVLEQLLPMVRVLCNSDAAQQPPGPCVSCLRRDTPHEPGEHLKTHLNGPYEGRLQRETTGGVDFDEIRAPRGSPEGEDGDEKARRGDRGAFRDIRKVESFDAMESYKPCWERLSHKQQEVVRLYHGEGKRVKEIDQLLHRSVSTVSGLLTRAKGVKADYDAQMRRQAFLLQREVEAKFHEI